MHDNHCWFCPDKLKNRTIIKDKNNYLFWFFFPTASLVHHQTDDSDRHWRGRGDPSWFPSSDINISGISYMVESVITASIFSNIVLFVSKSPWTSFCQNPKSFSLAAHYRADSVFQIWCLWLAKCSTALIIPVWDFPVNLMSSQKYFDPK